MPKYILKKAVRGIVPDELIDRPKQGFGVPIEEWLSDRLGDRIRPELATFCRETDILDGTAVNEVLDRAKGHDAWYLYNLAGWWREYMRD
jgi:asparagine synthase (glutamine-hydrolysing)